jgi:ketosteroid isomerase-like protein
MSEHPHIARLRDAYAAFGKGDLDALQAVWSPQLRWHVPGNSDLAGTYEGIPAVLGFLQPVMERTGRDLEVQNAHVSRFEDGRIVEFQDTSTDLDALDAFWA